MNRMLWTAGVILVALASAAYGADEAVPVSAEVTGTLNLSFEEGTAGWFVGGKGYEGSIDESKLVDGKRCLRIAYKEPGDFGVATSRFPVEAARGKRLRLAGSLRTVAVSGAAGLWMRVDGKDGVLAFDNMLDRGPSGTRDWERYEVTLEVPAEAVNINFGALLQGTGTIWVDGLSFSLLPPTPPAVRFTLEVRVKDGKGKPAPGSWVAAVAKDSAKASATSRTGPDGRAKLEIVSGIYALTASSSVAGAYMPPEALGPDSGALDLALDGNSAVIAGRMRADDGKPIADAGVAVYRVSKDQGDMFYGRTNADGKFSVGVPPPVSQCVVTTEDPRYVATPLPVEGGRHDVSLVAQKRAPAPEEVVRYLRQTVSPLKSGDPGSPLDDLEPLGKIVGDARVVALGEATHGSREFFQMKHRVLRYLVEKLGFTVFAIEANWPESLAADDYVMRGEGDAASALAAMYFWTWNTEEVRDLIEWMRRYNADPAHERKVRFYGFDMQTASVAVKRVADYLAHVDKALSASFAHDLRPLSRIQAEQSYGALAAPERAAVRRAIEAALSRFDAKKEAWIATTSALDFTRARQHLVVVAQAEEMAANLSAAFEVRDRSMAENIEWILATEPEGTRVCVWAHNGHINRKGLGGTPMGGHLARDLTDAYVALGFVWNQGSFQAVGNAPSGGRGLHEYTVGPAPLEDFGSAFARVGPLFLLDLRKPPSESVVKKWLAAPHPMREIGALYANEEQMEATVVLPDRFDAIVFVDKTTRARPMPPPAQSDVRR